MSESSGEYLASLNEDALAARLAPLPAYRAKQLYQWIWQGVSSFSQMNNLPVPLRAELEERFTLYGSSVQKKVQDGDGTVKFRIGFADGAAVETVLLRDGKGRLTACLSSQAGCPVGCVFCKTGSLGFSRNLEAGEISEQFLHLLQVLPLSGKKKIDNLVIMGMGEPLLNQDAVEKALRTLAAGAGFSPRRVTVSTSGLVRGIRALADRNVKTELAFSLTTAREELRRRLMPGCASPLAEIREALLYYQKKIGRRITLEIVLLGGINTSAGDVRALLDFSRGLFSVVNVLPWNPVEGLCFEGNALREPSSPEIDGFIRAAESGGLKVTRRYRKGAGISGACGQLGVVR